ASGQVVSIETTADTGETVTMDIGCEYQLIYGQMKDLQVAEGDFVKAGDLIGYISEPTKYYSVEGSNLYFSMTKNGAPVNPLNYLE
ncbi:MAG: M23 family metallopeptidase, partial [Clostridiales bacterium]|nr:M23 family metallopeptidase [Clostridiales bacterium]